VTAAADPKAAAVASEEPSAPEEEVPTETPPRLAQGTELIGQFEESGLKDSPYVVKKADGQLVQLPHLLFLVAENLDGSKSLEEVARAVSAKFEKEVGPGDVKLLVEEKLQPLGLLDGAAGPPADTPQTEREDPLLALKLKTAVLPAWIVRGATTLFYPLFFPPVLVAALGTFIALDIWLFLTHGVAQSFRHLLNEPALLLLIFACMVLGTIFHEMGHATACRYGGAKPGVMGVGLYIIWPAFYTDVNDAYRLGRWGRIRTDLGGVYFNLLFCLAVYGLYFLTGFELLLLLILGQHMQMFQQFMPFLRLDGYYVVSDLTGVPDLFARIGPILRSFIPGREPDPKVAELKGWVRGVVRTWVLLTIPALLLVYALLIAHVPRLISTGTVSFGRHSSTFSDALSGGRWSEAGASVLHIALLVLPTIGAVYVLARTAKRLMTAGWRVSTGRPALRAGVLAAVGLVAVTAAVGLWPDEDYRPIGPDEHGTLLEGTRTLARTGAGSPATGTPAPATPPGPSGSPPADDLGSQTGATDEPDEPTSAPAADPDATATPTPRPSATPAAGS
jgi:putative peptide zinc metalloprotease protein